MRLVSTLASGGPRNKSVLDVETMGGGGESGVRSQEKPEARSQKSEARSQKEFGLFTFDF
jgi:hypothetical protein